jgi:hypothetical protein
MKKRKKYIIDKKYQLRTTFSIIGIVTVIVAVILGAITFSVVYNNDVLKQNNVKIQNIYDIEDSIFSSLSSLPGMVKNEPLRQAMIQNARNHSMNIKTLENIISYNNTIITYNKYMLLAILLIIIAECVILYIILIRKTHRVSGPIYVISNFMKDIIEGRKPKLRPLRDKDELKEFYELFKEMVAAIEERQQKHK